jgi:HEAT repeat protein
MVRIGAAGDPQLGEHLGDHSEATRHLTALTLVHGGEPNGIEALLNGLDSDDTRTVEGASYVLAELICIGGIDGQTAFDWVHRLYRNDDPRIRLNAVKALILFESSGAAQKVLQHALEDTNRDVAAAAEKARKTLRGVRNSHLRFPELGVPTPEHAVQSPRGAHRV